MLRWLESAEEDLKNMAVMTWTRKSQDRQQWGTILEGANFHQELQNQKKKKKKI
jgi:hypothetical protein